MRTPPSSGAKESAAAPTPGPFARVVAWAPFLVFVLLASAIGAIAHFALEASKERIKKEAFLALAVIADLKADQLQGWLTERLKSAEMLTRNAYLGQKAESWFARGAPADDTKLMLAAQLGAIQRAYGYQAAYLLDERGSVRLAGDFRDAPPSSEDLAQALAAVRAKESRASDIHLAKEPALAGSRELDLLAPLLVSGEGRTKAVGAVYLRASPDIILKPLVKPQALSTTDIETVLFRREGEEVLYLNPLGHGKDGMDGLLRRPLGEERLLAAQALRGQTGLLEGVDYRGREMVGMVRSIPGSSWFLLTKVNANELFLPLTARARHITFLALALFLAAGLATLIWWRQQRAALAARISRGELERSALVRHFDYLVRNANDIILLMDEEGCIVDANERAAAAYGYSREELMQLKVRDLRAPETLATFAQDWKTWDRRQGLYETMHRRKDGSTFPVEGSAHIIHVDGKRFRQAILRDISERRRYEAALEHQSNYDALTSIPNRNLLADRLAQALAYAHRHDRGVAVLFLDLDQFKFVNDTLGHAAGDALLKAMGARLLRLAGEGETVARYAGDEFVLVLADISREDDASLVAQKVLHALAAPLALEGRELVVTCSIGIALYPKDGEDAQTLLKNADIALHHAKGQGHNSFQFYAEEMNARAAERLALESSLRHALERDEFVLHYQPQVDIESGRIVGAEALLRWQHPELGLIPPTRFIPLAEETGLIVPIGEWVLRTACAQNRAWQAAGLPPLTIAVNLSARQFRQPDVVEMVARVVQEAGIEPRYLDLELTESMLLQNVEAVIATLGELKALGVEFSIDDFGTGYSSLSYLKRFPIDTLKIDQSFVRDLSTDPDAGPIARAIISMGHNLRLKAIAEGVETEEQRAYLARHGCDEMKGYYFSKPLPAAEFVQLLEQWA